ncbi:D-ribose pyranase [Evansella tamaricis]|uniref:D-ribose pyranase n=1 Tax=Evansella tamaricis TaxID=2069301 RepID=A0ABS6JC10_9BACI|nr:D-ribose pyranase [Evansella tamaricis]MBU9711222.1 D-ribose pyranase [Evansella tamaricis]
MKKHGILNRDIAQVLAKLGHTDKIVIADCGLPVPAHVPCIDLSIKLGFPSFESVLDEVLNDMVVEEAFCAEEMEGKNKELYNEIKLKQFPIRFMDHESFKVKTHEAKVIIRTGEATPYANIILSAGVLF